MRNEDVVIEMIKLDEEARLMRGSQGAAGYDLRANLSKVLDIPPLSVAMVGTGIKVHIKNQNIAAMILPRSGKGHKDGIVLGNLVGLIDSDYQGELKVSVWNRNPEKYVTIAPGEAIAQLVFVPVILPNLVIVDYFGESSQRGEGGFGSTDVQNAAG